MKIEFDFNDKDKSGIKKIFFQKVFEKTLSLAQVDFLHGKKLFLSLVNISEEEIKEINKKYRHIKSSTDVLSFSEYKNKNELEKTKNKDIFLGEIILCYNDIKKYCKKKKQDPEIEIGKVSSHGLLHLLGFRHCKKMFEIQETVSKKIN